MDLSKLSPEEKAQLLSQLEAEQKDSKAQVKAQRDSYKSLVDETINEMFPKLVEASKFLAETKSSVYDAFDSALAMKQELYGVNSDQKSHTFTNKEATARITLGHHVSDAYDDTVNEGIAKVKAYIASLAKDKESEMLVSGIMQLLSRDKEGNLKASRVMQLRKMAEDSENAEFIDGVKIIEDAYRPVVSKQYVRAEQKNDIGAWINVPLGMTES